MKKIVILGISLLFCVAAFAQKNPSSWNYTVEEKSGSEATLLFRLKLDKGWHVYSQNTPDGGPLPMVYKFNPSNCYELIGKCTEPVPHEEFDSIFGVKVMTFDGEIGFRQKVKIKDDNCKIQGTIEYQVCKEACIFKDTSFVFTIGN